MERIVKEEEIEDNDFISVIKEKIVKRLKGIFNIANGVSILTIIVILLFRNKIGFIPEISTLLKIACIVPTIKLIMFLRKNIKNGNLRKLMTEIKSKFKNKSKGKTKGKVKSLVNKITKKNSLNLHKNTQKNGLFKNKINIFKKYFKKPFNIALYTN